MEKIPAKVIDYAKKMGYTGQRFAAKINGISYFQLYTKQRLDVSSKKTGFPLFVRIKSNKVIEASFDESCQVINKLTSLT